MFPFLCVITNKALVWVDAGFNLFKRAMKQYRVEMLLTLHSHTGPSLTQVYSHRPPLIEKLFCRGKISRIQGVYLFYYCLRKAWWRLATIWRCLRIHQAPSSKPVRPEKKSDGPSEKPYRPSRRPVGPSRSCDGPSRRSEGPSSRFYWPSQMSDCRMVRGHSPLRLVDLAFFQIVTFFSLDKQHF